MLASRQFKGLYTDLLHARRGVVLQFPEKLWDAVSASRGLIDWSADGLSVLVDGDEIKFEMAIAQRYPGLVDIPTFANFRRQLREYGFAWRFHRETNEFEFTHPSFVRGRPDLLPDVRTRRVAFRVANNGRTMKRRGIAARSSAKGKYSSRSSFSSPSYKYSPSPTVSTHRRDCSPATELRVERGFSNGRPDFRSVRSWNEMPKLLYSGDLGSPLPACSFIEPVSITGGWTPRHQYECVACGGELDDELMMTSPEQGAMMARHMGEIQPNLSGAVQIYNPSDEEWWLYCKPWICPEFVEDQGLVEVADRRTQTASSDYYCDGYVHDVNSSGNATVIWNGVIDPPIPAVMRSTWKGSNWFFREITDFAKV